MTPTVVALAGSLAVAGLAVAWVRPVPVTPRARPRTLSPRLPGTAERPRPCPRWFASAAERADLSGPAHRWFEGAVAGVGVCASVAALLGGPVFAVLVGCGAVSGCAVALRLGASRRDQRLVQGIAGTLDAVARSTRAGSSVVQALASLDGPHASPSDRLFAEVAVRAHRGEALADALSRLAADHPGSDIRLAVAALAVSHETGAPPARAVEGVAATLRDRAALEREARAHASQARASAAVLVVAPVAFSVFAMATDPRVGEFLFRSWIGWLCLGLGAALDVVGALWMRSIMATAR